MSIFIVGHFGHAASLFVNTAIYTAPFSQPSSIFFRTPISVPFSNAAATLSLSPSCRLTCSAVLCVPSLILTSTRNLGGRACSSLTRTPRPITVAREQCVIVGVMRTVSVVSGDVVPLSGNVGARKISGRLTTESEPRVRGCSGSEMGEMTSMQTRSASLAWNEGSSYGNYDNQSRTGRYKLIRIGRGEIGEYHKFLARRLARLQPHHHRIALNLKKRKARTGLEDMPMGGLCWKINLWGSSMMVERGPAFYGLVGRRRF